MAVCAGISLCLALMYMLVPLVRFAWSALRAAKQKRQSVGGVAQEACLSLTTTEELDWSAIRADREAHGFIERQPGVFLGPGAK